MFLRKKEVFFRGEFLISNKTSCLERKYKLQWKSAFDKYFSNSYSMLASLPGPEEKIGNTTDRVPSIMTVSSR